MANVCTVRGGHAIMRSRGAICWCVSLPVSAERAGMQMISQHKPWRPRVHACVSACVSFFFLMKLTTLMIKLNLSRPRVMRGEAAAQHSCLSETRRFASLN